MLYLSVEAQVAVGNIHAYVPRHVRPPVALGDKLQGFEAAWVSSHLGVVAERDYPAAEVGSVRDVDATAVIEEAVTFRPSWIGGSGWTTFIVPVWLAGGQQVPPLAA